MTESVSRLSRARGRRRAAGLVACSGIVLFATPVFAEPPVGGMSLGGVVRDGPSTRSIRLGALREGQPLRILRNAGARMNGYDWFAIRYRGRIAYQWGGIMCSNRRIRGMYQTCAEYRASRGGRGTPGGSPGDASRGEAVQAPGLTYGGHLRAGPSRFTASRGVLRQGQKIFIIRKSSVRWNGFDWFLVRWRGRVGYHWGGIMCADTEISGVFRICGSR